jgi:hypothetical protein
MSDVFKVELSDGRAAAVKARPDATGRTRSCTEAQLRLAEQRFSCARPLTPAIIEDGRAVHAEDWLPGGEIMLGDGPDVASAFAQLFADVMARLQHIRVPPPLPNPAWVGWDHDGPTAWPPAAFLDERDSSTLPSFIEDVAHRVRHRLRSADLPAVLGHADWETQNLRWKSRRIHVVHDWDSLAHQSEAALVGAASGAFASNAVPTLAPIASSRVFLEAYQSARGRWFDDAETEVAWAASLYPATHNARGQCLFQQPPVAVTALQDQADERLSLARA